MQYEVPLPVTMNHDMNTTSQYPQNSLYVPNGHNRIKSEAGSDRGVSPHTSDHSSRYSSQTPQNPLYQQLAGSLTNGMNGNMRYPSPSQQQSNMMPLLQNPYQSNGNGNHSYQHSQLGMTQPGAQQEMGQMDENRLGPGSTGLPKAFACSTCAKGFARRSDLARHERIHSGHRPHVCDFAGCGKQFIQRSALTVHSRVHTGEKPHMCERCGKPFSDSSSLARHRRIHSGKRPYQCPYADCQKTFTRRTTLTRHQNHHTGTIEESQAATAAALASRGSNQRTRGSDEENEFTPDAKSPMPPAPDRPSSVVSGMNGVQGMPRQTSDYYMSAVNGMAVPNHLRSEMQPSPRPQSPAQYPMSNGQQSRQSMGSNHSSGYNPPQILEPPPHNGQAQGGSGHNSPGMGWSSPHNVLNGNQQNDFSYSDGNHGYTMSNNMYYAQSGVQRPHSTGPLDYANQMRGQEMWTQHQS